jgi:hypothetical protein
MLVDVTLLCGSLRDILPRRQIVCVSTVMTLLRNPVNVPPLRCIVYVLLLSVTCGGRLTAELENCCPFREEVYLLLQLVARRMLSKRNSKHVAQHMTSCEIFGFLRVSYYPLNAIYFSRPALVNSFSAFMSS